MNSVADHNPSPQVCSGTTISRKQTYGAWIGVALVFAGSLLLLWLVQKQAGAARAGFGGFPDEPAHYVAGLLVHDYLPNLFHQSPMQFVRDYYARVPYFALGVWPPLFYCIE